MQLSEGIAISSFVLATIGFMYRMSRDVAEIKKQVTNDIQHITEEEDVKRRRVYERLDEYKKTSDEKFTNKEVCNITHSRIDEKLDEMGMDIKILLKQNGK